MSGLAMGHELKQHGFNDFTIYEKAGEVGGTWRENRYPGLSCDVPSRYYSYSYAPNPEWTSVFSPGPEIFEYFRDTSERLGLRPHIEFGAEVADATWSGTDWRLTFTDGREDRADVVVTATGVLHHPKFPDIPGIDSFAEPAFHSAQWDDSAEVDGRRVAVIGTGSTGVQLTCALAERASHFMLFQRSAQWLAPVPNRPYRRWIRSLLRRSPALNDLTYRIYRRSIQETIGAAPTKDGPIRKGIQAICRANLRLSVRDPELRRKLTPDHEPMCKRLVMTSGFYKALQQPTSDLVTEPIERISERGIVTADGTLHEADVVIFATGFDARAYMRPMAITGPGGVTLEDLWAEGPRAYLTVALPEMPNLFTLMGPHSPIGNHSLIAIAETQSRYVRQWLERMRAGEVGAVAPTAAATDAYNASLHEAAKDTVWASGCSSWYIGPDGTPELWPWSPRHHQESLATPIESDFAEVA